MHREALGRQRDRPGLQPREVEQLLDEPPEPLGLGECDLDRLRVGGRDAVGEVLEHRPQRADRRPQLVRDVGDEVAAHPLDVREVGGHRVEGARELADLVARAGGDAALVVAARHRRGRRRHLAQRRGHAAGEALDEREPDHDRDHDAQPERQPELVAEREDHDRRRHGGDDHHAELGLDRAKRVERPHAAASSA